MGEKPFRWCSISKILGNMDLRNSEHGFIDFNCETRSNMFFFQLKTGTLSWHQGRSFESMEAELEEVIGKAEQIPKSLMQKAPLAAPPVNILNI